MSSAEPSGTGNRIADPNAEQRSIRISPRLLLSLSLLMTVALISVQVGFWWAKGYSAAQSELELADAHLGVIHYDYEAFEYGYDPSQPKPPRPWYYLLLPDQARPRVVSVSLPSNISPDLRSQLIEKISRLPHVRHLDLGAIHCFIDVIGPPGAEEAAEEQIYANKIPLASRDFEAIGRMANLRVLDLTGTTADDEGLSHLENLAQLETLWLRGSKVTAAGIQRLQLALPHLETHSRFGPNQTGELPASTGTMESMPASGNESEMTKHQPEHTSNPPASLSKQILGRWRCPEVGSRDTEWGPMRFVLDFRNPDEIVLQIITVPDSDLITPESVESKGTYRLERGDLISNVFARGEPVKIDLEGNRLFLTIPGEAGGAAEVSEWVRDATEH